eukprot:g1356.t1
MENPEPTHSVMDTPMLINSIMESTDPINSIMESTDPINSIMESTEPINSTLESTQPFNYVMESPMLINSTLESTDPIDSVMESPLLINSTLEDPIDYVMESPELANASLHETKTLVPSLPEVVLSYNSTSLSPSLDTSSSFLSILQSPDWKSLSVEDRFDAFINSPAPENLLNVTSSELTPDLRQSMESLYPFKRYRRTLTDPITTVSTLHAVVRSEPRFLARVILTRDDDKAVAFGLRVPSKFQKELSERTPDRNDDGDVIFIKGLAYAGLEGRSSSSLANIIISSLNDYNKNQIRPFVKSVPVVRKYLKKVLNDSDYLKQIVDMDANDEAPISLNLGRKLLVRAGSPIDAFTCSYCFPNQVCEIWQVLTNFNALVDVVPNLIACEELPGPDPQTKRIRQSAGLKCSWWRIQAEALIDVQSFTLPRGDKELRFKMIKGDFKEYHGRFLIEAQNQFVSKLTFDAVIEPMESIPEMLFVHAVQIWLPFNLNGIVKKSEQIAVKQASVSPFTAASIEADVSLGSNSMKQTQASAAWYTRALEEAKARRNGRNRSQRASPVDYLGTAFVPLPASAPEFRDFNRREEETVPSIELNESQLTGVEVHLRKLDSNDYLHRRVVCCIRINAPVKEVWTVLTDYERLSEFVPNLVKSEIIVPRPASDAPQGYKRLRQVVKKRQSYIQLQAESILDVVERPYKEIQFRQVSGFVQRLQGKWVLKNVTNEWDEEETLLTYALELKTPHSDIPLELIEPVFEQAAVEGLPINLIALKQEVLKLQGRPSLMKLSRNFEALRDELVLSYGMYGNYLPTRLELRKDHRTDLEKAIAAHGGAAVVTERMGWKSKYKQRKRRGYWDDFRNVEQEIMDFKMEYGLLEDQIPSKNSFNQAGRVDLRRAVEKWGGIQAVMELIELERASNELKATNDNETPSLTKMKLNVRDLDDLA